MWHQILAVGLGFSFLLLFFSTVKSSWPESYFVFGTTTDPIISRTIWRYLLFRTVPYFVVSLFVATLLERDGREALAAALVTPGLHVVSRVALGLRPGTPRLSAGHRILRLGVVALALLGGLGGYLLRRHVGVLVPGLDELSSAAWTGVFAAVAGAALLRLASNEYFDPVKLVDRARSTLDPALLDYADRAAEVHDADPLLVRAVMMVEAVQRPPWVRFIERSGGRVRGRGSYGVMQVTADHPISDLESIDLACSRYLKGHHVKLMGHGFNPALSPDDDPLASPYADEEALKIALRGFHRDDAYFELVSGVLSVLLDERQEARVNALLAWASQRHRWRYLQSKDDLTSLAMSDPAKYLKCISSFNGAPSADVFEDLTVEAPLLRSRVEGSDVSGGLNKSLAELWAVIDGAFDDLAAIAKQVGLTEVPLMEGPELTPGPPAVAHQWSRTVAVMRNGIGGFMNMSPESSPIHLAAISLSMTIPTDQGIWFGGYVGQVSAHNKSSEPSTIWPSIAFDFGSVITHAQLIRLPAEGDIAEIRSSLLAVRDRFLTEMGRVMEDQLRPADESL